MNLEAAREMWLGERRVYAGLAAHVRQIIQREIQRRGVLATYTAREKDLASLLKKLLRKKYEYDGVHDKAGVRVTVDFPTDVATVEAAIREQFIVQHYENKTFTLEYDRLAYLGIHFEVTIPNTPLAEERWRGLLCEIQVQTLAQNCWAEISHQLIYKSDEEPPGEVKRRIYRLMALVELFDESIGMARDTLLRQPGFEEGRLLHELERWFYRFTAQRFDRALSLEIIGILRDAYSEQERSSVSHLLDAFVAANREKLEGIYTTYRGDDRCSPLLFQPEALMVFERLETDEFRFKEFWLAHLPETLLENLASVWGLSI